MENKMTLKCSCDECNGTIDVNENTYCSKCYDDLLQKIKDLETQVDSLESEVEDLSSQLELTM